MLATTITLSVKAGDLSTRAVIQSTDSQNYHLRTYATELEFLCFCTLIFDNNFLFICDFC